MSSLSVDRKVPLDYGVQIRFIKDLHETGGVPQGGRIKGTSSNLASKYGVAVRVQGVSGQPYVVLKEGEKGDSYGVQLKAPQSSFKNGEEEREKWPQNPYASASESQLLRRGHSQDSLLLQDGASEIISAPLSSRPPGDGRSGSSGNLMGGETGEAGKSEGSVQNGEELDSHGLSMDSFPDPPPPVDYLEDPISTVDTNSLGPINKLISKFDGSGNAGTAKDRAGVQDFGQRRKSTPSFVTTSHEQSTPHPYMSLSASSASSTSSLGRSSGPAAKPVPSPSKPVSRLASRPLAKQVQPVVKEMQATPDLLKDQGQNVERPSEDDQRKQVVYSILREGSSESDSSLKYKVGLIFETLQTQQVQSQKNGADEALKAELEDCLDENVQLQEQLDRKKAELHETHSEMTQLRMDREEAEAKVRVLEDQRAELQEELRQMSEGHDQSEASQKDLLSVQTALAELTALHRRQEETLRQRERELTALKGVLKDEVASHDQDMEALREQYSQDIEKLRSTMEEVTQSQFSIEAERERVNASVLSLQQQLNACRDESSHWRAQFDSTKEELLSTKQELMQAQLDKDEFEEELKDLQERLVAMKKQIPDLNNANALQEDLKQARLELEKKNAALASLKKSSQDQETEMKSEIDRLKDQLQREKKELAKALEKPKQVLEQRELGAVQVESERLRDSLSTSERELQALRDQLTTAQKDLLAQKETQQGLEETNARLRERLGRLETRLQSSVSLSSETEEALEEQNRSLRAQLEESRRAAVRLGQEREELLRRIEERDREREMLRRGKIDLEEQKRLLDRALDKLTKEMEQLSADSRQGVQGLQGQLEELRERSRKDVLEAQRLAKERLAEIQRGQALVKSLQEEVSRLKKELLVCSEERESALLDKQLFGNRLKHVEEELDLERTLLLERARDIRGLEDKVKTLELELDEEKGNVELLNERVNRSRDQVDQLRSELMQERSSIQDLELDKSMLERQVKDLKAQLEDVRDAPRVLPGASQLESKVQELEQRLHSEEREKSSLQSAQRRMERKLKELNIALDEERHRYSEQRDQMALRMKALKRQLDEKEGELERLEGLRRKAVREAEEHLEQQEVLQARVSALEADIRRKVQQFRCPTLDSSTLSSEDEDGFFSSTTVGSIVTEPHLQTS